jgi:hypothetical protein
MINQVIVTDITEHTFFIHKERKSILHYEDDLTEYVSDYFVRNPREEVYKVCVIDFENNKSVIYEFVKTITRKCTVY